MKVSQKKPIFIYIDDYLEYHFHDGHPFNQKRLKITKSLLEHMGHLPAEQIMAPRMASEEEVSLIHTPNYIDVVKSLGQDSQPIITEATREAYGLGTGDTPVFPHMHQATSRIVGGTLIGAELIMQGEANHVLNIAGGLHHALPSKAAGFCIYNDCSIAIQYLRKNYNLKVLYLDIDAHHGDGVQWAFYDDPDVFTFSIHETGRYLFPGTGNVSERGDGLGYGYSLNIPLDAFTQDESWLSCFSEALQEIIAFFKPDIIVSQHGCDAHFYDPLTHLSASMRIYAEVPQMIKNVADTYCEGKWLALGGGGYDIWRVVPRAWSLLWMAMNQLPLQQQKLPLAWNNEWQSQASVELPTQLLDDESNLPFIPRQEEIEKYNAYITEKALQYIRNHRLS